MKLKEVAKEVQSLIRAKNTLLWVVTREEQRAERMLQAAAFSDQFMYATWDCADGFRTTVKEQALADGNNPRWRDPAQALEFIRSRAERRVYVLRDFHAWKDPMTVRALRSLARELQEQPKAKHRTLVVLSHSAEIPPELQNHVVVVDLPLPDREEMGEIADDVLRSLVSSEAVALSPAERSAIVDAALGLSAEEAAGAFAKSLVSTTPKAILPAIVTTEKKAVVSRERVLTWYEPEPRGFSAVGGYEVLRQWCEDRRTDFSEEARAFGLPAPKGMFLLGPPGTGKSLVAKAIASSWGMPLLRLDMGALRSKFVGESEGNIRRALSVAETVAPAIMWIDEIEKALAGSTGQQGDGGVGADALGVVLTWMQERKASVFVVATSNDVTNLPPELLRRGRFDELFFIDLPNALEREDIVLATLRLYGRESHPVDAVVVAEAMDGFVGAEIAACVADALRIAFHDGARELRTEDVLKVAANTTPLARGNAKITALREWAKTRTRNASVPSSSWSGDAASLATGRKLDL